MKWYYYQLLRKMPRHFQVKLKIHKHMVWTRRSSTDGEIHYYITAWAICGGKRSDDLQLPGQDLWEVTGCCRWAIWRKLLIAGRLLTEWEKWSGVYGTERSEMKEVAWRYNNKQFPFSASECPSPPIFSCLCFSQLIFLRSPNKKSSTSTGPSYIINTLLCIAVITFLLK